MREKNQSDRYTREPQAQSYLEPRTVEPDDVELTEKESLKPSNGNATVSLGIDGDAHYQTPASAKGDYINQDLVAPTEDAPMIPKQPGAPQDDYLAPVNAGEVSESVSKPAPDDDEGYLPPQNLAVNIDDATANYTNL